MAFSSANAPGVLSSALQITDDLEQGGNAEDRTLLGGNVGNRRRDSLVTDLGSKMKLIMARTWKCLKQKFIRSTRMLSLGENSSATLMAFISNIAVMGIVTLTIYSASYFLAWKKDGSTCHIFPDSTSSDEKKINGMIQLIVIGLPFTSLPLALCIGSLAEVAKDETRYLGCVACLVMVEIIYMVFLGAVMTVCMSDVLGKSVAIVTAIMVALLLLLWGCCCHYPVCWRHVVLWKCCCPDIDMVELENIV